DLQSNRDMRDESLNETEKLAIGEKITKVQEEAKAVAKELNKPVEIETGRGMIVVEGRILREVHLTMHTTTALTAAERRDLPSAVAKVAQLLGNILSEGGMRKWGVKAHVDTQVCDKEIAWTVTKVPLKTVPEEEVVKRVRDQLEAVYVGRIKGVWITNRKSCPVCIRGLERTPALTGEDVIDETIRSRWPTVQWGERHAHFTQMGVGNKGV